MIKTSSVRPSKTKKHVCIYSNGPFEEIKRSQQQSAEVCFSFPGFVVIHFSRVFPFSIQTVSLWVIHHRRHSKQIVEIWLKEMKKSDKNRKLVLIYLANDVIQNSKKKGPEYGKEFANGVLAEVFGHVAATCKGDDNIMNRFDRILSIWEERGVYEAKQIKEWYACLHPGDTKAATASASNTTSQVSSNKKPEGGEKRKAEEPQTSTQTVEKKQKIEKKSEITKKVSTDGNAKTETVEVNGKIETHITLSPKMPEECDPPEPEELIKVLLELESSASSDAVVREKITNLPPEVVEISLLQKLADKDQAAKLSVQVDDAIKLLNDYNARLAEEMVVRKKLTVMLRDFQIEQKELLAHAEKKLEEHKAKLKKAKEVAAAVKDQLKKLPDLSQLPDITLPSAGDLFNLKR